MSQVAAQIEHAFPTLMGRPAPRKRVRGSLKRLEGLVWFMDDALRIPGTSWHVGGDVLIGMLPGVGSLAAGALQLYVVVEALRLGVSRGILARMIGNIALDTAVGTVPIAGTLFDAYFRASRRNLDLLVDAVS